jgi:hypothetical protein
MLMGLNYTLMAVSTSDHTKEMSFDPLTHNPCHGVEK